uniref:Uncharacterized protein n=1 Tax=Panagrolaimus davidi TaxID=227884 RepID=A0A914QT46_9BILA
MKDAIKTEMQELLPNIQFKKMKLNFLKKFVVQRGFLFTSDELADILKNSNRDARVKITNSLGKSIYCDISYEQKREIKLIKLLNGRKSDNKDSVHIYWNTNYRMFSSPSPLNKRNGVQWYLIFSFGDICVRNSIAIKSNDYLIAETDFDVTPYCKIKIV